MDFIKELGLNRHLGQYVFSMHRITGIALTLYLLLHIALHSTALLFGPVAYNRLLSLLDTPLGRVLELLTVLAVVIHMSNGIRLILIDFFDMARVHRRLALMALSFTVVFMGYAVWVIL